MWSMVRKLCYQVILAPHMVAIYNRFSKLKSLGKRGEREAERFYLRQGLYLIERGYADAFGEIDLILVDNRTVVFAEVKTRTSGATESPAEAVDETKQRRISQTALAYLKRNRLTETRFRFDIVSIVWPKEAASPEIRHYPSAFELAGDFQLF